MKKLRRSRSMYASGAPRRVSIEGEPKLLSREELFNEVQNLRLILASLIEDNDCQPISFSIEAFKQASQKQSTIIIEKNDLSVRFKYKDTNNESTRATTKIGPDDLGTIPFECLQPAESFYESDAARDAREYLRQSRNSDDGDTVSGVHTTE